MLAKNKTKIICAIGHACHKPATVRHLTSARLNANRLLSRILPVLKTRSRKFESGLIHVLPFSFFSIVAAPAHAVSVCPGCFVMSGASGLGEGSVLRGGRKNLVAASAAGTERQINSLRGLEERSPGLKK